MRENDDLEKKIADAADRFRGKDQEKRKGLHYLCSQEACAAALLLIGFRADGTEVDHYTEPKFSSRQLGLECDEGEMIPALVGKDLGMNFQGVIWMIRDLAKVAADSTSMTDVFLLQVAMELANITRAKSTTEGDRWEEKWDT